MDIQSEKNKNYTVFQYLYLHICIFNFHQSIKLVENYNLEINVELFNITDKSGIIRKEWH